LLEFISMFSFDERTAFRVGVGISAIIACFALYYRYAKARGCDPPGPPRLPIVGNLFNFPSSGWAGVFSEWHKRYGEYCSRPIYVLFLYAFVLGSLIYVKLLGMPVYIIGDPRAVEDVLVDHGKISDGRPPSVMVQEM
jgi:hypothetical protein